MPTLNLNPNPNHNHPLLQPLLASLASRTPPIHANPAWLNTVLTPTTTSPLNALAASAHARFLASDITTSLHQPQTAVLPTDISAVQIKERTVAHDVIVQVLDVRDVGASRASQIEAIERVERGEEVRGREIIRSVPDPDAIVSATASGSATVSANVVGSGVAKRSQGPHVLTLQDCAGTKVMAFELEEGRMARLWIGEEGMAVGCKVVLKRGVVVRRGMVMMTGGGVVVLGGRVESWERGWREGRKERLLEELGRGEAEDGGGEGGA